MNTKTETIFIRLAIAEKQELERYCVESGRTKSEVLRSFIRTLNSKKTASVSEEWLKTV